MLKAVAVARGGYSSPNEKVSPPNSPPPKKNEDSQKG